MNSCKRPRFYAIALAALLLAGILLWCHVNQAAKPEPTAAAGPRSVVVCGTPFGVKMFSDGALVVAFADRYSASGRENPAQLTPWADASGVYKAGLWVRDSSAGIGTLTFVDPVAGSFAGLGHPISDVDTGADFTLLSGEIVPVTVTGVRKASPGAAGELRGEFLPDIIGTVTGNDTTGLYGRYTAPAQNAGTMLPVASPEEVHPGDAELWTALSGRTVQHYTVRIERVGGGQDRDLTLRVTDPALLDATGGIVQGMSGSPLVQNGKLVGAVTHVLVGTPAKGYGIFADTMVKMAETYTTTP